MTHIYNPVASGQQEPMPAQDSQPEQAKTPRRRIAVAIAGTLLTIIAWVLLFFSGTACIACAAIAVAVCAFGSKRTPAQSRSDCLDSPIRTDTRIPHI